MEAVEHPGCMMSGFVLVNRVPGNFHLEARSKHHNLNAAMTNLSHVVNHLSFGTPLDKNTKKKIQKFGDTFGETAPIDGNAYINRQFHTSYHHYTKVVSTHYEVTSLLSRRMRRVLGFCSARGSIAQLFLALHARTLLTHHFSGLLQYQMLTQSQIMHYEELDVPEAKFSYDLSPMAVIVSSKGRRWYDFVTSLMAIIGGTFTVVGMIDGVTHRFIKGGKQY